MLYVYHIDITTQNSWFIYIPLQIVLKDHQHYRRLSCLLWIM